MEEVEGSLKVLTFNVNFGICRNQSHWNRDAVLKILECVLHSDCDIVFLQETNEAWEFAFYKFENLKKKYTAFFKHRGAAGGAAFLVKMDGRVDLKEGVRMIDTRSAIEESWFEQLYAKGTIDGNKECHFLNVHLRPPKGWMSSTSKYRKQELEFCLSEIDFKENDALLVCGDFNEDDNYSALQLLKERGLKDALELKVDPNRETMSVDIPVLFLWNWRRNFRLDHVCFSTPQFELKDCKVIENMREGASDHQPVMAEFKF